MVLAHDLLYPYIDSRVYKEAVSLIENEYDVTVVCWAKRIDNFLEKEQYDGINIIRATHNIAPPDTSRLIRGTQYLEHVWHMAQKIKELNPEIIHCHDFNTLPEGLLANMWLRKPLIYDSHEDWPEQHIVNYPLLHIGSKFFEKIFLKRVSHVITVNSQLRKKFVDNNTTILMNTPMLNWGLDVDPKPVIDKYELENKIVITYHGRIGQKKGIIEMIEAASVLTKKYENLKFLAIGRGDEMEKHKALVKEKGLESVFTFTGVVPHETIPSYLKASDIGFCVHHLIKQYVVSTPFKVLEDMSMGIPMICNKEFPELQRIVGENNTGILVNCNIKEIVDGLQQLIEDKDLRQRLGKNGRKAIEREYNWENQEEKLLGLYEKLLSSKA